MSKPSNEFVDDDATVGLLRMSERQGVFSQASVADTPQLVRLMADYYAEDNYPFNAAHAKRALHELISCPALGWLWRIDWQHECVGYLAVTLGFSLEYHGRDAFLDELYVMPHARGHGLGRQALMLTERQCRDAGVHALHLEVERDKSAAMRLYQRRGFRNHERVLLHKILDSAT